MAYFTELGIDEAGRGPVLGPMVMAGVVVPENKQKKLQEWGIADSKTFGSGKKAKAKRAELADKIKNHFQHNSILLPSDTIDEYVRNSSLNILEQITAREIINRLKADSVILDGKALFAPLETETIKAFNKADSLYLSVAAASILAKVERDKQFSALCQPYVNSFGEIGGGGYANNKTLEFVEWYLKNHGGLPSFYRTSYQWKDLKL